MPSPSLDGGKVTQSGQVQEINAVNKVEAVPSLRKCEGFTVYFQKIRKRSRRPAEHEQLRIVPRNIRTFTHTHTWLHPGFIGGSRRTCAAFSHRCRLTGASSGQPAGALTHTRTHTRVPLMSRIWVLAHRRISIAML